MNFQWNLSNVSYFNFQLEGNIWKSFINILLENEHFSSSEKVNSINICGESNLVQSKDHIQIAVNLTILYKIRYLSKNKSSKWTHCAQS